MNNQSKKVTFEPTLLIYEGNEVQAQAAQERRNHQQPHLPNDFYQGVSDLIFMNNQHETIDNQILNIDKDNGQNYANGNNQYFQSNNYNANSNQQQQKKNARNNTNADRLNANKNKPMTIKQSKSLNDMSYLSNNPLLQQSSNINYHQIQNQQQQPTQNKTLAKNDSSNSLTKLQSNPNLQISNIKGNVKNTYIKKISSLINVQQSNGDQQNEKNGNIKQEIRESDDEGGDMSNSKSFENQQGDDSNDNKRLKKNRESARNSRQRKKIYIDLLEKKVTELTKEIDEVCVYIEKSQSSIQTILSHNPFLRGLVQERLNFIEKIQKHVDDPKPNEDDLNLVIDSFRLRLGATGRIRQHAINLFFRHMYKSFLENNYEYFLYGYEQNQDDDDEFNRCVEIFKDTVGLPENDNQIYSALPILKKFLEHRKQFKKTFREMKNIQKEWVAKTTSVENLVDKISPLLTAGQVGKLIDQIDKKRQQPELNSMKKKYNQISSQQMANSLSGQFNAGNNPPSFQGINNYSNLNQQLMTPSQILSANNALGNNFPYNGNNGTNQNPINQIKSQFMNNLDFNADNGHNIQSEVPTQNFYTQIQFQNYRMYQPVFQIQQPPYFSNSMQGNNTATAASLNTGNTESNVHHIPHINNHHHSNNQHLQNHQIPSNQLIHDNVFQNNQSGLPFFDILNQKDDRDAIKQPIGSMIQNNDHYFITDNTQKKRKQY